LCGGIRFAAIRVEVALIAAQDPGPLVRLGLKQGDLGGRDLAQHLVRMFDLAETLAEPAQVQQQGAAGGDRQKGRGQEQCDDAAVQPATPSSGAVSSAGSTSDASGRASKRNTAAGPARVSAHVGLSRPLAILAKECARYR